MARYFVFLMDGEHILDRIDFDAEDDREAMTLLALRRERADCDIWCSSRFVASVPKGVHPLSVAPSPDAWT